MKRHLRSFFALETAWAGHFHKLPLSLVAAFLLAAALWPAPVHAAPFTLAPHNDFFVPQRLRPRVNFWKDIFTKYGKYQVVIHHRDFPQAVFTVLDFSDRAAHLGPIAIGSLMNREVDSAIKEVKAALRYLSSGAEPATALQQRVQKAMQLVHGDSGKYRTAIDEDLVRGQTGIREKFIEAVRRSGRYLPIMEKIFQDYGLPREVTRLPFVESSFDYTAYSSVGAAGIWQFMPKTGRLYMTVNNLVDERRDPIESTHAAAKYLLAAYNRLGTWPLAITSYNHGVAGVVKKVRRMGTTDIASLIENPNERVFGFASSNFYPEFLAALESYEQRHTYFSGVTPEEPLHIAKVQIPRPVSIAFLSQQLGVGLESLRRFNYALSNYIWNGRAAVPAGYTLKVPVEYGTRLAALKFPDQFIQASAPAVSAVYGGVAYRVRKGDTLLGIARKHGVTVDELRRANNIKGKAIHIGQSLTIKSASAGQIETRRKETAVNKIAVQNDPAEYRVSPGDTLFSVARQFHLSVDELKKHNNLTSTRVSPGQKLLLPLHQQRSVKTKIEPSRPAQLESPKTYTVHSGDSPWTISRKLKIDYGQLVKLNSLSGKKLKPGQTLKLP